MYRLVSELNSNTQIKVKTPLGKTETAPIDPGMTQGSVDAAIISSANVAGGLEEFFKEPEKEIKVDGV